MKSQRLNTQEQLLGSKLIDTLVLSESRRDLIFACMMLTAIGVFIGGNALLLMNMEVLSYSWRIAAVSFGVMCVFYAISRIVSNVVWGLVLTYGLLFGLVYTGTQSVKFIFYGLAISAFFYTIKHLRVSRKYWAPLVLMAVIGVLTVLGVRGSYSSFDIIPRLHAGMVHQDTLFHASIAAMFKNYSLISTGLNGLVELSYYIFSHILMAAISILSGSSVLEVYGVAPLVLFSPLLIFAVTASSAMLDQDERLSLPIVWGVTALLLSILPWLFSPWALWDSFFVSESYLVSLGVFVLGLGLLFKRVLVFSDLLLILVLAVLISSAKASVGIIFGGLWFTRVLFISSRRYLDGIAAILALFGAAWMVLSAVSGSSGSISISPLDFISYSYMGSFFLNFTKELFENGDFQLTLLLGAILSVGSFWLLHFGVSWAVIVRSIQTSGIRALLRSPISVYSIAAIGAGSAIVLLYRIPGGSAYYFTNVALFVSLPSLVGFITLGLQQRFKISILHCFFVLCVFLIGLLNARAYLEISWLGKAKLYDGKNSELVSKLDVVRESSPINEVQRASNDLIKINPVSRCSAQPFVFSAVSERAWVELLKVEGANCSYEYYGYDQYFISNNGRTVLAPARLLEGMWIKSQPDDGPK
ncbi:hypothetical protein KJF94_03820 [Pseudomonas hormoni]|uniref:Glycosyltransferase RgtA/B/C/D-like domain-containing protein n=1 Tax=Pseudomonas hormoni TaxID=3093767 RepID=A0ABX8EZI3_9PSED|nr:hypothetical protein [Pseudomonas hormoni]QVW24720.1 hypothetical protein KJF94_03820 [Pseudomonas hormoni]